MATTKPSTQPTGQEVRVRYSELVKHTVANAKSGVAGDLEQSAKARIQHNQ